MFTDQPVTPLRLETLLEVVGKLGPIERSTLSHLLQPDGLPDLGDQRVMSARTLRAALELNLVSEEGRRISRSKTTGSDRGQALSEAILTAFDEHVLLNSDIEPYFGPFYSYLLGLNADGVSRRGHQDWATDFNNAVFQGQLPPNPLNATKVTGLWRWYPYVGLGWLDGGSLFHCNPYGRLVRSLPKIFARETTLASEEFMSRIGSCCPELDGGAVFRESNAGYNPHTRECTLGLSHALIDMHLDGIVLLQCPPDSSGWSLGKAEPPRDSSTMRSDRFSTIELKLE